MRNKKTAGFTLIEAILVITIGTVLLASGTFLYRQYRQSVGDAAALDKVMAFQGTIESLYSMQGATPNGQTSSYPSLATVTSAWTAKRPSDYNMSPWGGYAIVNGANLGVTGGAASGYVPMPAAGDTGALYYWTTQSPTAIISAPDSTGVDANTYTDVSFLHYLVAMAPNKNETPAYWFVRGARQASVSNSFDLSGQVGSGGGGSANAPSDPW